MYCLGKVWRARPGCSFAVVVWRKHGSCGMALRGCGVELASLGWEALQSQQLVLKRLNPVQRWADQCLGVYEGRKLHRGLSSGAGVLGWEVIVPRAV